MLINTAPDDFEEIATDLVFPPDGDISRMMCVNLSIVLDEFVEDTEIFNVTISTSDTSVIISKLISDVFILDDSGKSCKTCRRVAKVD